MKHVLYNQCHKYGITSTGLPASGKLLVMRYVTVTAFIDVTQVTTAFILKPGH